MDHYWRVLLKNPANIYAANGLGIILAERGELNEAKDFFIKVREATTTMPDVWLNLGHVYLAQGEFVNAIKMYQNCLRKFFGNKNPEIMLFLAKAHYEYGQMQECKQTLLKALHITPNNNQLWFNLALSQESFARQVAKKDKATLPEMKGALSELSMAERTFQHLASLSTKVPHTRLNFNPKKAEKHVAQCQKYIEVLQQQATKAEEEENAAVVKREALRRAAVADEERRREEQLRKIHVEEEEKARLQLLAEEQKKRLEALQAAWAIKEPTYEKEKKTSRRQSEQGTPRKKKQKQKKSDDFYSDADLEDDDDIDIEQPNSPKSEHSHDSGEEEGRETKRAKRQRDGEGSEDEAEHGNGSSPLTMHQRLTELAHHKRNKRSGRRQPRAQRKKARPDADVQDHNGTEEGEGGEEHTKGAGEDGEADMLLDEEMDLVQQS